MTITGEKATNSPRSFATHQGSHHQPAIVRGMFAFVIVCVIWVGSHHLFEDIKLQRASVLVGICLILWLLEIVPLYATTLCLWVGTVLFLTPLDPRTFSANRVLSSAISPVVVLMFGGYVLSVAGTKYGIDAYLTSAMVKASRGNRRLMLLFVMIVTAVLSMWMLNTAAAAMMLATLRPLHSRKEEELNFRVPLILGVAFGANFGGMGTPIGTGPNLIAINAIGSHQITFFDWMKFGVPLALLMVGLAYVFLLGIYRVKGSSSMTELPRHRLSKKGWSVVAIFFSTVALWLFEPLHHIPAATVALAMAAVLFSALLLDAADLKSIGWETLLLIAGGISLGQLFDDSGLAKAVTASVKWNEMSPAVLLLCLVGACAAISAVSSNTAAAAILVPIGMDLSPAPTTAVLIALGASMGAPFVISTPPNSMAYGEGGLKSRDFLLPGSILMLGGSALVALAGPSALRWLGLP